MTRAGGNGIDQGTEDSIMPEHPFWQLRVAGRLIPVKPDHPLLVHGKGWVEVTDLVPGDPLLTHDGQTTPVQEVIPPAAWGERN
jgi:hypothetical protein